MVDIQEKLNILIRKRETVQHRLHNFVTFVTNFPTEVSQADTCQLDTRLDGISLIFESFCQIQDEIELIVSAEQANVERTIRDSFENEYYSAVAKAKGLRVVIARASQVTEQPSVNPFLNAEGSVGDETGTGVSNNSHMPAKLPVLQTPKFDGSYDKWLPFHDTFTSLIHNNLKLTTIEKFRYLRDALQGEAAQVINSFETTSTDYEAAWSLVQKRYENKKLRIHNHIKGIVEFPAITRESCIELRKLLDVIQSHIRALKSLKQPVDEWDTLLIYLISDKFDNTTKREWEITTVKGDDMPSMDTLVEFLEERCRLLEKISKPSKSSGYPTHQLSKSKPPGNKPFALSHTTTHETKLCPVCQQEHFIHACKKFLDMSIENRIAETKKLKMCLNCLRLGHISANCKSSTCKKCSKRHNTLLHLESRNAANSDQSNSTTLENTAANVSNILQIPSRYIQQLLATAVILVYDDKGHPHEATALLDAGSQANFMTEAFSKKLGLNKSEVQLPIIGIGGSQTNSLSVVSASIKSRVDKFHCTLFFSLLPNITQDLPQTPFEMSSVNPPSDIGLADPQFNKKKRIDLLLGVDIFWEVLCHDGIEHDYIHKTKFGYVVSGRIPIRKPPKAKVSNLTTLELSNQLTRFWEVESVPDTKPLSPEELTCEEHFRKTHKRDQDGRFIIDIPLLLPPEALGDSLQQAEKRFLALERRLQSNPQQKSEYIKFMEEYQSLGHMSPIDTNDNHQPSYYMPHHAVTKGDSLTTKLRVVFDASAPTTNGVSFNDLQMVGPTIQADLFSILLQFRRFLYVLSSDVAKMYRQILVEPQQRHLQRILWRSDTSQPVQTWVLNTVTYGTSSAPFQAIRCLFQLASECERAHPKIAKIIRESMYVDDLLCGADDKEEAIYICQTISSVLKGGGFELRRWLSNDAQILDSIPNSEIDHKTINLDLDNHQKTLGLCWCSKSDTLVYKLHILQQESFTKRSILSVIARIFDPLGLLSPVVITAKIILQKCWQNHQDWDEPLSLDIQNEFTLFHSELSSLNELRIPRHIGILPSGALEVHAFSDSSSLAYGTAVYIRSLCPNNKITVRLLCAKSKVAPIKTINIPRLELLAALMMTRLVEKIKAAVALGSARFFYWTDSTIVLGWIHRQPNSLETFVANRVSEIQSVTDTSQWFHVPSTLNPADLLTRGIRPSSLQSSSLWWEGPSFLQQVETEWPVFPNPSSNDSASVGSSSFVSSQSEFKSDIFNDFDLNLQERIVAWILRFKHNCKNRTEKRKGPLTYGEIRTARHQLAKISQLESFHVEIRCLKSDKSIPKTSRLTRLHPFLHTDGSLRVGGRIRHSTFEFSTKHPLILSSSHVFTRALIEREHKRLLHCGPQQLLYQIRQNFWPLQGYKAIKCIIRACRICSRARPRLLKPLMGDLPNIRVTPARPFDGVGVDYAGPFLIKDKRGRGCKLIKHYVCLFVCLVTKAIHLELVSDLSADAFISTLRRFVSRRGRPHRIFSDNGKNFVGAHNKLHELGKFLQTNQEKLQESFVRENLDWSFIPAYSPHFGGIWEAGVKSTKHHLKRVTNSNFTFEEFYTLLCQIEAILNSRPLTPLSNHPSDLEPLTPGHFLVGCPLTALPERNLIDVPEGRLDQYHKIQQAQQHFWRRWSSEYISQLQERTKWTERCRDIQINDLVIIKDDNQPPMKWRIGRVVELHPGADLVTRVVSVRTSKGVVKRAVHRLCVLPTDKISDQDT